MSEFGVRIDDIANVLWDSVSILLYFLCFLSKAIMVRLLDYCLSETTSYRFFGSDLVGKQMLI